MPNVPYVEAPSLKYKDITGSLNDNLLKNIIHQSQVQYMAIAVSFNQYKLELDTSREESLGKFQTVRNARQSRPLSAKNSAIIVDRMKLFEPIKREIGAYLHGVDESMQPHMKVYQMSIAAQSRVQQKADDVSPVAWPLDVPKPQVKHRLLGNILDARLQVSKNAEMIQFVDRLSASGFPGNAAPLYSNVIKECTGLQTKLSKRKAECDQHHYSSSLAVEILLVQAELMAIAARALKSKDKSKIQHFRQVGMEMLDTCETYLQEFPSCGKYMPAVTRAKEMLRALGPFYESVSQEERSTIYQAMQAEFGSAVRWYYCGNGHPVSIHGFD